MTRRPRRVLDQLYWLQEQLALAASLIETGTQQYAKGAKSLGLADELVRRVHDEIKAMHLRASFGDQQRPNEPPEDDDADGDATP